MHRPTRPKAKGHEPDADLLVEEEHELNADLLEKLEEGQSGVTIQGQRLVALQVADDIAIVAESVSASAYNFTQVRLSWRRAR